MEEKNENKALAAKLSSDIVRVGNSLAVTNKLLHESKFEFRGIVILKFYICYRRQRRR